jgi:hypothetical protein
MTKVVAKQSASIYSPNPQMISSYGKAEEGSDLIVDPKKVCRLYINDLVQPLKIPTGFAPQEAIRLLDPNTGVVSPAKPFINFLVQQITLSFQETVMPQKNLTSGYVSYVFGQEPPIVPISGILLHTNSDNWSEQFLVLYTYFLRATKLAELSIINNKPLTLVFSYQNKRLYGSLISLSKTTSAVNEQAVSFSMNFLLKRLDVDPLAYAGSTSKNPLLESTAQKSTTIPPTKPTEVPEGINNPANSALLTS